jgi:hypothetical protein
MMHKKKRFKFWCKNQLENKLIAEVVGIINENRSLARTLASNLTNTAAISFLPTSNGFNVTVTIANNKSAFFRVRPGLLWGISTFWPTLFESILHYFKLRRKAATSPVNPDSTVHATNVSGPAEQQSPSAVESTLPPIKKLPKSTYEGALGTLSGSDATRSLTNSEVSIVDKSEEEMDGEVNDISDGLVPIEENLLDRYQEAVEKLAYLLFDLDEAPDNNTTQFKGKQIVDVINDIENIRTIASQQGADQLPDYKSIEARYKNVAAEYEPPKTSEDRIDARPEGPSVEFDSDCEPSEDASDEEGDSYTRGPW